LLAGLYSAAARDYAELWAPVLRPASEQVIAAMPLAGASTVLDLGTGTGARPVVSGVGIDLAGSSEAVIRNNTLRNNSTFDIEWDGTGQNTFTGNRCTKASRDGLCGL
jgi:hypothetical protein